MKTKLEIFNYLRHMNKLIHIYLSLFFYILMHTLCGTEVTSNKKIAFWNTQQTGANIFNQAVTSADIQAAKAYGIGFIRLAPDKFKSSHRNFLIGNADAYRGLVPEDLKQLKNILDICYREHMPVVLTILSLPGSRWKQNNQGTDDLRIWKDTAYQAQAALFWYDLETALKDHPAVVGYNLLNEPHPEQIFISQNIPIDTLRTQAIQTLLHDIYRQIIQHIRMIDTHTPIILDSSEYADAQAFRFMIPQTDTNVLYSFHMYEPYTYTNYKLNTGRFQYPGHIQETYWNQASLKAYMAAVVSFQETHSIESTRILVGEFGAHRMSVGIEHYFRDLTSIFDTNGWHSAFYAFREDTWDGMDYELGARKLPWSYWQAMEHGEQPDLKRTDTYPAFSILMNALK